MIFLRDLSTLGVAESVEAFLAAVIVAEVIASCVDGAACLQ